MGMPALQGCNTEVRHGYASSPSSGGVHVPIDDPIPNSRPQPLIIVVSAIAASATRSSNDLSSRFATTSPAGIVTNEAPMMTMYQAIVASFNAISV
jgi:hypothetical protein